MWRGGVCNGYFFFKIKLTPGERSGDASFAKHTTGRSKEGRGNTADRHAALRADPAYGASGPNAERASKGFLRLPYVACTLLI